MTPLSPSPRTVHLRPTWPTRAGRWLVAGAFAAAGAPLPATAQTSGNGFLFKEPSGSFGVRGGYARAMAGSDIFSFSTEQLTLSKGDFAGFTVGADLSLRLTQELDLVLSGDYAGSNANSEFRELVEVIGSDTFPITQVTSFKRVPLAAGLRWYLTPRGRAVSNFAWIPNRYAAYLGAGAGAMWYRFRQEGDFVDFEDNDIFTDEFTSSGWTPMVQGLAGLEYSLGPWFALSGEVRYSWARAEMDERDANEDRIFEGFDKIDLSGLSGTIGFKFRF